MTFNDLVISDLKASVEAAEANNFTTALNLCREAINDNKHVDCAEQREANQLKINRQIDYIEELMKIDNSKQTSWLERYYAGSAGASAINDVKRGRAKTIKLGA